MIQVHSEYFNRWCICLMYHLFWLILENHGKQFEIFIKSIFKWAYMSVTFDQMKFIRSKEKVHSIDQYNGQHALRESISYGDEKYAQLPNWVQRMNLSKLWKLFLKLMNRFIHQFTLGNTSGLVHGLQLGFIATTHPHTYTHSLDVIA